MITLDPTRDPHAPDATPFGPVDDEHVAYVDVWVVAAAATRPTPVCAAARRKWGRGGTATVDRDGVMHTPGGDFELYPAEWADDLVPVYLAVRR